jgi:uncharacterized protein YceH (UPF0502 family)
MRLARRPGQKEERWIQLLTDGDVDAPDTPRAPEADPAVRAEPSTDGSTLVGRLTSVEKEIADLRTQVESLRADLDHLRTQLGS